MDNLSIQGTLDIMDSQDNMGSLDNLDSQSLQSQHSPTMHSLNWLSQAHLLNLSLFSNFL